MLAKRLEPKGVRGNHPRCSDGWHADSREDGISTQEELLDGRERPREDRSPCLDGRTIGTPVTTQEALVRQRRPHHLDVGALLDVGDHALDGLPEDLRPLLLELLVLRRCSIQALPKVIGLCRRGVGVNRVVTVGGEGWVEHRRDGDEDEVLLRVDAFVPICDIRDGFRVLQFMCGWIHGF